MGEIARTTVRMIAFRSFGLIQDDLHRMIPKLRTAQWTVNSPYDTEYTCIAWAACRTRKVWWPWDDPGFYWPPGFAKLPVGSPASIDDFAIMFEKKFGYRKCATKEFEWGFQKVAIYANTEGVTHMSRQCLFGEEWLSKLGVYEDVIHSDVRDVEGSMDPNAREYGEAVQYMKRTWPRALMTACLFRCAWAALKFKIYRTVVPWEI